MAKRWLRVIIRWRTRKVIKTRCGLLALFISVLYPFVKLGDHLVLLCHYALQSSVAANHYLAALRAENRWECITSTTRRRYVRVEMMSDVTAVCDRRSGKREQSSVTNVSVKTTTCTFP